MTENEINLNDLKLKIGLIEKDIEVSSQLSEKLSQSIEKIEEMSLHLVKMITLHEQRHSQHDRSESELKNDIKELHSRVTTQTRELHDKIDNVEQHITNRIDALRAELLEMKESGKRDDLDNKVEIINKWRWMVVGGAVVAGWILGNLNIFSKILN